MRGGRRPLRGGHDQMDRVLARRQRQDAGDRQGDPGGRFGLPQQAVFDDRHRWRRARRFP